jgi:hypothetical protein
MGHLEAALTDPESSGWEAAFNRPALISLCALLVSSVFLGTITQDTESGFGFLLNFFLMWFAPPLAWFVALRAILPYSAFVEIPSPAQRPDPGCRGVSPPSPWHCHLPARD